MAKLLIHLATGPENPTRGALALLVARTAVEEGHDVHLFLAGDAAHIHSPVGHRLLRYTDRAFSLFTRVVAAGRFAAWVRGGGAASTESRALCGRHRGDRIC